MKIRYFLLTAVLATAILCSAPAVASAAGLSQDQINAVVALVRSFLADPVTGVLSADNAAIIANVQTTLNGGTPTNPPTAWCHTFNVYLYANATGVSQEVADLQTALTKEGYDLTGDDKGTFGESTAAAVVAFQGKYGIRQTGAVGPLTRAKLNSLYGCATTTQPSITSISPTSGPAGTVVTITGSNLASSTGTGSYINFNSSTVPAYGTTSSAVVFTVPTSTPLGSYPVSVTNSGHYTSNAINFAVASAAVAPTITTTNLSVAVGGQITLSGTNLGTVNTIKVDGSMVNAYNLTPTASTMLFTLPATITAGSHTLQVWNNTGASNTINFTVTSPTPASTITVTSPNGGETWQVGTTHRITWNSTGVQKVRIYIYVTDVSNLGSGSTNYVVPNNGVISAVQGYYDWTIGSEMLPLQSTLPHNYKIRVDSYDNGDNDTLKDSSDNYFTITAANTSAAPTITTTNLSVAVGGQITLSGTNLGTVNTIKVDGLMISAYNLTPTASTMLFTLPATITAGSHTLQVWNNTGASNTINFTVTSPTPASTITVTSPNGGEQWIQGSTHNITWNTTGLPSSATVTIYLENLSNGSMNAIGTASANAGSYSWALSSTAVGSMYKIFVNSGTVYADASDNFFSIISQTNVNQVPTGYLDGVINTTYAGWVAYGWAVDPDAPSAPVTIYVYIDGNSTTGTYLTQMPANVASPDVTAIYPMYTGNHRFVYPIPAKYADGKPHTLYVYAIDSAGGTNFLLVHSPTTFTINNTAPVSLNANNLLLASISDALSAMASTMNPDALSKILAQLQSIVNK
ncbi:MAG: IPT/TIG domain-containing protein [Candidatus Staskawiczbacteria bacterium]|nr:IPT/TIG domain-containing protein [Candidatus Staskawiczbacteria bacterium]